MRLIKGVFPSVIGHVFPPPPPPPCDFGGSGSLKPERDSRLRRVHSTIGTEKHGSLPIKRH